MSYSDTLCPACGKPVNQIASVLPTVKKSPSINYKKTQIQTPTSVQKPQTQKIPIKNFFQDIFKIHTKQERNEILTAGLSGRKIPQTINLEKMKPWLYSRVFLLLLSVQAILEVCLYLFRNANMFPGVMFIGALVVPITVLIFFFELNVHRNISLYMLIVYFLLGGVLSLLFTLAIGAVFHDSGTFDFKDAMIIGVCEELGKALPILMILKSQKNNRILNGLLIGSAVGCGFAVFESAGYAFNVLIYAESVEEMNLNILLRGVLSLGGHVAWGAMIGAILARENEKSPQWFLFFAVPIFLHTVWDWGFDASEETHFFKIILLCIIAWVVLVFFINKAIEISDLEQAENSKKAVALKILGNEIPLLPRTKIVLSQIEAGGQNNVVVGEVISNKMNPNILGIKNLSGKAWIKTSPSGKQETIDDAKVLSIARGIEIQFSKNSVGFIE